MSRCSRECGWRIGFPFAASTLPSSYAAARRARSRDRPEKPECQNEAGFQPPSRVACWRLSPIPILLAFDLDGRKTGRQCAARHDVIWPDCMRLGIEIDEVAASHIDGANA